MLVFSFIPLAFPLFLLFKTHLERAKAHSRLLFFFDLPLRFATPVLFIELAYTSIGVKSGYLLRNAGVEGAPSGVWVFSMASVTN